ncbi:hypothetical protein DSM104329_03286 [Capillimicrobium parvum]|uniref:Uncharacterized protein n=2 Tax=Capillimicrobium parvum TaxID=2884022 RepID=A0A9E6XYM3_9ACTN|nr:hypothetical protein DSM104329_03286 [Capillimicrobium parvum]
MGAMQLSRGRRAAIYGLLVAGAIVAILAIFAVWTARQLLEKDNWDQTTQALIADDSIHTALATYLVDQVYTNADPAAKLRDALPPRLQPLAAPAAGALREPAVRAVEKLLDAPRLQVLWAKAASITHDQFIALVNNESRAIRENGDAVVLDVRPLIALVGDQLGLPIDGSRLPESAGVIKIMDAQQLDAMRTVVKLLKTLAIVLFLLALVLLGIAIWLARGHRREITAAAALSLIVAAIVVLLLRRVLGNQVIGDLANTSTGQAAADSAFAIGTSLLAKIARTLLLLALLLLLGAWLSGPSRLALRIRTFLRPALLARPEMVHGAVLAVLLALLAIGVIPGIRTAIAALLLVIVAVVDVEMVRRRTVKDPVGPVAPAAPAPAA